VQKGLIYALELACKPLRTLITVKSTGFGSYISAMEPTVTPASQGASEIKFYLFKFLATDESFHRPQD
jgi:hypothetical protein